ncbi:hypothetical protein CDQ84_04160 [Clostridium thermosuccinogenes]|uniref:HTH araC/xylS-type domain-containing protein n=1 Tax=Clostridium thermosuccinogenes TaxID=84032 RepID=A0A2K2FJJ0_9CLOT|nr:AraC family transcriptional regulator [Pseudoclostridium thermosuccinogenes]AUS98384.1 hypothetical protein CDO33_19145 [Pseudoclostridium thermosuccinogenes]PNT98936.1 hypothetical protein CDQ85_04115 [Pseudoclostridium thermosuccinogenes]PNU00851.1 hypothetical protein CDQ84_04160 [Pseudoclostridium thermosuccinogenes]
MSENQCVVFTKYSDFSSCEAKDLVVYHSGTERCEPGHFWSGVRDHFLIHYVMSGKGIFASNGTTYHLSEGQGFLICPDTLSYYQADMDEPWEYCWVGFHGRYAKNYLNEINLDASNPIFTCNPENSPEKTILKMLEVQKRPAGRDFILTGLLYQFLAELIRTVDDFHYNSISQNTKQIYVKKAIDYIRKNYSTRITIEQIADFIGIDRKYMSTLFQEILHISPQEYLLNFRMDKACVLLCQDFLSIQDIAHSVGYEDPLLFSKMFKKRKGLSPTQYRNRLKKNVIFSTPS